MEGYIPLTSTKQAADRYRLAYQNWYLQSRRHSHVPNWSKTKEAKEFAGAVISARRALKQKLAQTSVEYRKIPLIYNWLRGLGVPPAIIEGRV